jgi:E3 ubiquitin-protein ligase HUWE1
VKSLLRYILEGLDSVSLDLEIYREDHYAHANSLAWIMNNDPSSDGWERATQDLSFSVDLVHDGHHGVHELIEGGAAIPVTDENKADYVQRVIEYKLRQSIRPKSFLTGFHSVLPRERLVGRFTADELDTVIAGDIEVDVADLKANTQYTGYTATDQQVVWFWEVVDEFDQGERNLLIKFTSGTALAPVGGFASLPFKIARVGLHDDPANNPLPSAHTCYNQLNLPAYTSKEELSRKLILSITSGSTGFGFE